MRAKLAAAVLVGLCAGSAPAAIRCGEAPGDDADLLVLRLLIDVGCDCNGTRSAYMTCARQRIDTALAIGTLRPECVRDARRCASRSRCGRPGRVTCCKTVRGEPRCKIRKTAAACTGSGGTVGICPSCCGACTNECFEASTTTTTTTLPGTCGDTAPECGGSCPPGQFCARDDDIELTQIGCRCFPVGATPCMQAEFAACGGACLDGEVCQPLSVAGDIVFSGCFCVPPDSTCGPFPGLCMSFGACPAGQICSSFVTGGSAICGCVTTTTAPTTTTTTLPPGTACSSFAYPVCGGNCEAGFSCQRFQLNAGPGSVVQFCQCVVTGSTCQTPPGGGCAFGQCPPDQSCTAILIGQTVLDCGCGPP